MECSEQGSRNTSVVSREPSFDGLYQPVLFARELIRLHSEYPPLRLTPGSRCSSAEGKS